MGVNVLQLSGREARGLDLEGFINPGGNIGLELKKIFSTFDFLTSVTSVTWTFVPLQEP